MNRRGFLGSIIAACSAPAIIMTPGLLMPIKPLVGGIVLKRLQPGNLINTWGGIKNLTPGVITNEALRILHENCNFLGDVRVRMELIPNENTLTIRLPDEYLVTA